MAQVPCARCGTFLPAPGLCAPCLEKDLALKQLSHQGRFVAVCLSATALMLVVPMVYVAILTSDPSTLLFGLMPTGPLIASTVFVVKQRRPGAGLAGLLAFLLCPNVWVLSLAATGTTRGLVFIGLSAAAWLLAMGAVIRMSVLRRQLSARGLLPRAG